MADQAPKSGYEPPTEEAYSAAVFQDGGALVVNLSNIKEMTFETIPKGIYDAEVDEITYGMSQSSNAPMWTVRYNITQAPYENRKMTQYLSFSRKALPGTKSNIMRLAPELSQAQFAPETIAQQGTLIGRTCRIRVGIQDYEGQDRNNVSGVLPAATAGQTGQAGAPAQAGATGFQQ
jgi:hypothetical protein